MTRITCLATGTLTAQRAAGLTEGQGLDLEEHLAECESCAEEAARLGTIASLLGTPRPMSAAARERVIANALRVAKSVARPGAARTKRVVRWWTLPAAASLSVAATVLLAVLAAGVLRREPMPAAGDEVARVPASVAAPSLARVVAGRARIDDVDVEVGATWRAGTELSASAPTTLAVAHASVRLDAGSVARWDEATSTLTLARGGAEFEVDPAPKLPFRVETAALRVEVLGTEFRVDAGDVRVTHGRVRVIDRASGRAAELSAGESWAVLGAPMPAAASAVSASPPLASPSSSADPRQGAAKLAEARRLLAAGRSDDAETVVRGALRSPLSTADRAEARTLLAECAHARGDEAEAAKRYADVAGEFGGLPAGETALFAAARAEERAGRRAAAATLLRKYLATYPDGRFQREANARLRALDDPTSRSPR